VEKVLTEYKGKRLSKTNQNVPLYASLDSMRGIMEKHNIEVDALCLNLALTQQH
jgi:hypothetical protein